MGKINKIMNKILFTAIFITAIITWLWMIFAWTLAIIGA